MRTYYSFFLLLIYTFFINPCYAQQAYKLDNIKSFTLYTHDGGLSSNLRKLEVINENGIWRSYQTRKIKFNLTGGINDSSRIFIKDISKSKLLELLQIISKKDSVVDYKLFNIKKEELDSAVDSLSPNLDSKERSALSLLFQSKDVVNTALKKALTPFMMDDRKYFEITFEIKPNESFKIYAYSFADLYDLPWYINGTKNYNPFISLIFNFISNNTRYQNQERQFTNERIAREIYRKYFKKGLPILPLTNR